MQLVEKGEKLSQIAHAGKNLSVKNVFIVGYAHPFKGFLNRLNC